MSSNPFKPAWWLRSSHLQTIWPVFCRAKIKNIQLERERLELPDGDFIDLDWINKNKNTPLVIILHGLEGSIESHYSKGMLIKIAERGWRGLFMHFRGCSGEPNRFPQDYHSGQTSDINYVIECLLAKEPNINLAAVGYSLGGNVLLKWLGETGKYNPLKAAIAISVPFELHKASTRLRSGFSKLYEWYFIKCLRYRLAKKFKMQIAPIDPEILYQISTLYEFDEKITAPLHGFSSADDYYHQASSRQYLRKISVPTLILHAKDDPLMSQDTIPKHEELSAQVILELSEAGGHVGFVGGKYPWNPEYWLEERVPRFLQDYL